MIIGNKSTFAIEIELDKDSAGKWLFGRICYWIQERRIGRYELGTPLSDVIIAMKHIAGDCGQRDAETLCNLSAASVYAILSETLYGPGDPPRELLNLLPEDFAKFDITIGVDVFDDTRTFLLECGDGAWIIWQAEPGGPIESCKIAKNEPDMVLLRVFDQLNQWFDAAE